MGLPLLQLVDPGPEAETQVPWGPAYAVAMTFLGMGGAEGNQTRRERLEVPDCTSLRE